MPLFSRESLGTPPELRRERVDVPEWGDPDMHVYVRELTGRERDRIVAQERRSADGEITGTQVYAKVAIIACCDEDGVAIFQEDDETRLMSELSFKPLSRIYDKVLDMSAMDANAAASAEENSEAAPSGGSGTGSPALSA